MKWHPRAAVPRCRLREIRAACPAAYLQQQRSESAAFAHSFSKKAFCEQGESSLPSFTSYVAHLTIGQGAMKGHWVFLELQEYYNHAWVKCHSQRNWKAIQYSLYSKAVYSYTCQDKKNNYCKGSVTCAFSVCSNGERLWPLAACTKQEKASAPLSDSGFSSVFCYLTELYLNAFGKI